MGAELSPPGRCASSEVAFSTGSSHPPILRITASGREWLSRSSARNAATKPGTFSAVETRAARSRSFKPSSHGRIWRCSFAACNLAHTSLRSSGVLTSEGTHPSLRHLISRVDVSTSGYHRTRRLALAEPATGNASVAHNAPFITCTVSARRVNRPTTRSNESTPPFKIAESRNAS